MPSTLQSSRYSVYYSVYLHYQYTSTNTDAAVDDKHTEEQADDAGSSCRGLVSAYF